MLVFYIIRLFDINIGLMVCGQQNCFSKVLNDLKNHVVKVINS